MTRIYFDGVLVFRASRPVDRAAWRARAVRRGVREIRFVESPLPHVEVKLARSTV